MAALDDARYKLVRAREQLHALCEEIVAFYGRNPAGVRGQLEPEPGEVTLYAVVRELPNPYWKTLVGEIAHATRSALNYLACELVKANGGTITRTSQFPIYDKEGKLPDRNHAMVKGMSDSAFAFVEGLQPYHRANPASHPLFVLAKLSNVDKHQPVADTALVPESCEIRVFSGGRAVDVEPSYFIYEPVKDGAVVARFKVVNPDIWPDLYVKVEADLTCLVLFDERWRPRDLERFIDFVQDEVIERASRQFLAAPHVFP